MFHANPQVLPRSTALAKRRTPREDANPQSQVYVPDGWYHAVVNLADTVAVGGPSPVEGRMDGRRGSEDHLV